MSEVHPDVWAYLKEISGGPTPELHTLSVDGARERTEALYATLDGDHDLARVDELSVPGAHSETRLRVYTPEGDGPFPALVFFHGGGWVLGSLDTHDELCRALASAADCLVVSVDYDRAPEHKFPVPLQDCYLATRWVANNAAAIDADPTRIAVGGDSAGGNLAAAVALLARERNGPDLTYQLLLYPVLNSTLETESYKSNPGIMFSKKTIEWCLDRYLRDRLEAKNPFATPLEAHGFDDLPPAMVVTADLDLLRDDGREYASRLEADGVPVEYLNVEGMTHLFVQFHGIEKVQETRTTIADGLRDAFDE